MILSVKSFYVSFPRYLRPLFVFLIPYMILYWFGCIGNIFGIYSHFSFWRFDQSKFVGFSRCQIEKIDIFPYPFEDLSKLFYDIGSRAKKSFDWGLFQTYRSGFLEKACYLRSSGLWMDR